MTNNSVNAGGRPPEPGLEVLTFPVRLRVDKNPSLLRFKTLIEQTSNRMELMRRVIEVYIEYLDRGESFASGETAGQGQEEEVVDLTKMFEFDL